MNRTWKSVRKFLTAEEVPRWFGLSLVLIYLVGLGTVAQLGIRLANRDAARYFQRSSEYAVTLLAERLASAEGEGPQDVKWLRAGQRALGGFAATIPAQAVRIVSDGAIVASTRSVEVGTVIENEIADSVRPGEVEVLRKPAENGTTAYRLVRTPITGPPVAYVEAVLPFEAGDGSGFAGQAGTLSIVLVVLGSLFVVYRCLREQLRGVWRIADRLELHRERIEEDLASLPIGDALDGVTAAWNELVELTQRLMNTVQRAEANEELSRVLQRSNGGAVADALNALPDGIIYIADEVRFEFLNAAACRLLGWNTDEAKRAVLPDAKSTGVGERILDLLRGALQPEGCFETCTEILESGDAHSPDTSSYRVFVIPVQRSSLNGECVVVIRDVSQQLRAERAREEFVAQVTHELRTPLTNIRAYAETLSSGMFEDPNVITECYNVITKETRRLSRLIEDILSVSQLEVGTIELRLDNVDIKTLLTESLRDIRGLADDKKIDVQLVLPSKLETTQGDRDKLAVVVNNLLGNAIKYTPAGGNVVIGCQCTSDALILTFKDNGIGIDPADHARMFEKFQRGSNPEVKEETGTGIGLYTAREIVRRHGGDIELISERDKGSTFMVRLPHRESRGSVMSTAPQGEQSGLDSDS